MRNGLNETGTRTVGTPRMETAQYVFCMDSRTKSEQFSIQQPTNQPTKQTKS